ncbi:MAG: shikimate kinase [Phycisphaerae bacterium]
MADDADNVVLIGMAGAGKSTVGRRLADQTDLAFLDTDALIEARQGRPLQQILDTEGVVGFRRIEEDCLLSLDCSGTVVSTGGSVVFSDAVREHLRALGLVVWLDVPLEEIQTRLTNLDTRGVVMWPGETVEIIYHQRRPLYERWAHVRVDCSGKTPDAIADAILAADR